MKLACLLFEGESTDSRGEVPRTEREMLERRHGATMLKILSGKGTGGKWAELRGWLGQRRRIVEAVRGHDAVMLFSEAPGFPVAALLALSGITRPVLILYHGHARFARKNRLMLRLLSRLRNIHWLPISESLGDRLEEDGVPRARIRNVGWGVDTDFFAPDPVAAEEVPVVAAGLAHRDYRTLVEATAASRQPVRIAADSVYFQVQPDLEGVALGDHVHVEGAGSMRGLRDLYARAATVAVPLDNVDHACGYAVIYEAMAMGRPVVATRLVRPADVMAEGTHFLDVPPGDSAAMARALDRLGADPALRAEMGRAARARIVARDRVEDFAARLYAAAHQAVARRAPGTRRVAVPA